MITLLVTIAVGFTGVMMMNGILGIDVASNVIAFSRIGLFCFVYSIVTWYILRKELICPYIMYLVCAYVFLFGQCLFWAIGIIPQRKNLFTRYSEDELLPAMVFTILCLLAIQIGAILSAKDLSKNRFEGSLENRKYKIEESMQAIKISAWILFAVSVVPYYYSLLQELTLVLDGNYKDLYLLNSGGRFDEILELLESFYIPSLFMLIVAYPKNKLIFTIAIVLMITKMVASFAIGGRGGSFLILIGFVCIWHYVKKPINFTKVLIIALAAYILLTAGAVVGEVRNRRDRTFDTYVEAYNKISEEESPVVNTFGEMGWQLSSTVEMINHVPSDYEFRYGSSYFYAMTTIIPNLGFWDLHPAAVHANLGKWLQGVMNLNYGPGFSPTAEAYLNFGWFGILFMVLEGFLLGKILTMADRYSLKYNPEAFSISIIFLTVAVTFATRAASLTLVRSILYNVLSIYVLILVVKYTMRRFNKRLSSNDENKKDTPLNKSNILRREQYE